MDFDLNEEKKEIQRAAEEFAKGEFDKEVVLELNRKLKFIRGQGKFKKIRSPVR